MGMSRRRNPQIRRRFPNVICAEKKIPWFEHFLFNFDFPSLM